MYSVKLPIGDYKNPIIALIIGALITALSSFLLYEFEEGVEKREFSLDANARAAVMEENLANTLEVVHSIHALYAASEYVSRAEFNIFAGIEMSLQRNIQAIEWIPRVKQSERNQFEARARQDGLDSFRFTEKSQTGAMVTANKREEYYPVYYVYPRKGNEAAVGFDLASNPARLEALNKARDTGQLQATQRITLVQETGNQFGILVFQPIYEYGDIPKTVAERREQNIGFALGVIRISDVLEYPVSKHIESYVFDLSAGKGQQTLYPKESDIPDLFSLDLEGCVEKPIAIGGRSWVSVHCHPESYIHWEHHSISTVAGIAGIIFTLLMTAYVRIKADQKRSDEKALKALKSSETRYKDLVDNTNVLIQSINTETGMLNFANQGWKDALGYGDDEIARLNFADIIHPDELDHCTKILKSAIKTQKAQAVETIFVRKGGVLLNIEGHIVCRKNESGMMVTHGVFTDITERRKAEILAKQKQMDLIASEKQYRTLVDQLPLGIWEEDWSPIRDDIIALHDQGIDIVEYAKNHPERIKDLERRTVVSSVNDGALTMNKAASLEELETYYDENPELAFSFLPALEAFTSGRVSASCEGPQRTLNNDILYLQTTTFLSEGTEENWSRVISLTTDITESRQVNEERNQLVQAVKQINECVVLFDKHDRIIFCNEAYRKLNREIIDFTEPGTLFEDHLRAGVRAGIMIDGIGREDEWVAERLAQHRNPAGPIEISRQKGMTILVNEQILPDGGIALVISDITEIKESQAQVIQASKLATLGEMATSVAHELNQPLNVIRMAAGNSRRKVKKGNPDLEYLDQKLKRIETQTARAAAIIDHMRMFGRKAEEKPEQIDPRKVITNAIDLMGEQLRLAGIEVVTDFPDECSNVSGHTIQVEQVVLNLLTNARDAMTDREGDAKITLRVSEDGAGVHISCQDTGGGIPKDVIPRIFEPFYTTKEMGKGTGLGLSVSYGIIRDMGGSIVAENVDGGARFTIKLPALSGEN